MQTSTRFSWCWVALLLTGCGPAPLHARNVRDEVERHVVNVRWSMALHDGYRECQQGCDVCAARDAEEPLTLAGWETPRCDAERGYELARTPLGQERIGSRSYLELVDGGEVLELVITEQHLEVEAPEVPHARLVVMYRQQLSAIGRTLASDLHCDQARAPAVCARFAERQQLEFYATQLSRDGTWGVVRANTGTTHGAGGLHWN